MHIYDLFQKGKVRQVLTLDGDWILLPNGTFRNGATKYKPCTSVRQYRKMYKSEKETNPPK